jgi:ankyrin repeat protein
VNKTNCNLLTDTGCTPLAAAADCDRLQVAEHLLSIGADVTAADNEGRTPLHRAAGSDSVRVLKLLLKCDGVNVNAQDIHGDTPLMLARRKNATAAAQLLMRS